MKFHTYLTHTNPYQMIIVKDRNRTYYEGNVGLCGNRELWDREILTIRNNKEKTREVIMLRIRKPRKMWMKRGV